MATLADVAWLLMKVCVRLGVWAASCQVASATGCEHLGTLAMKPEPTVAAAASCDQEKP